MIYNRMAGRKVKLKNQLGDLERHGGGFGHGFGFCRHYQDLIRRGVRRNSREVPVCGSVVFDLIDLAQSFHQQFHEHSQFGNRHFSVGKTRNKVKTPFLFAEY